MVKNNRIEARVTFEAKKGLIRKAEDCGLNLSELLEIIGTKPIAIVEIVRQSLINKSYINNE